MGQKCISCGAPASVTDHLVGAVYVGQEQAEIRMCDHCYKQAREARGYLGMSGHSGEFTVVVRFPDDHGREGGIIRDFYKPERSKLEGAF